MSDRRANGPLAGLSTDELRAAIRAVLRDVVPPPVTSEASSIPPSVGVEQITLRTDGDLDVFVRRLAGLCEDSAQRTALREGRLHFRLAGGANGTPAPAVDTAVVRVDRGAVTERRVKQAATQGARLVVGAKAVLTPLARDRARTLGVIVEKEH